MQDTRTDYEALLQRLEWKVIRHLDGQLQGNYRSLLRGYGLDLADLREYQPEDDVRHIDWNITARLQKPYVRQYLEDREMTAWFLLDVSPSVDFGSGEMEKSSLLLEFVAVMARLLTRHGNRVGAILFNERIEQVVPPRSGRSQILHLLSLLDSRTRRESSLPTDLGSSLLQAIHLIPRRSFLFILSDFISRPGWERPLSHLARRHELLAVRLYDPLERELPNLGLFVMQDAETGEQIFVDTGDPMFRQRYVDAVQRRESELRGQFRRTGCELLELSTEEDLLRNLLRFIGLRKIRIRNQIRHQPFQSAGKNL